MSFLYLSKELAGLEHEEKASILAEQAAKQRAHEHLERLLCSTADRQSSLQREEERISEKLRAEKEREEREKQQEERRILLLHYHRACSIIRKHWLAIQHQRQRDKTRQLAIKKLEAFMTKWLVGCFLGQLKEEREERQRLASAALQNIAIVLDNLLARQRQEKVKLGFLKLKERAALYRQATINIQRLWRGHQGRKVTRGRKERKLLEEKCEPNMKLITKIQKVMKGALVRNRLRKVSLGLEATIGQKRRKAALKIQVHTHTHRYH